MQVVTQDQTTVNNIFREEIKDTKGFFKKLLTELLLSILEPDRFFKNAKAIAILIVAYVFVHLTFDQIKTLVEIYTGHCK